MLPLATEVQNTGPQHILMDLNSMHQLTIGLWMESCSKINLGTQLSLEGPPETRGELKQPYMI